jgi:DNA-binding NarL/FixJ family response regulator
MIKILITDDHPIVREGLKLIMARAGDMTVVAEAKDGAEALEKARRFRPDVVLLDISLPGRSGLEILKQLKTSAAHLSVLVLSQHQEDEYAMRALRAGASGYLTKESASNELIAAIRKVAGGGKYVSASLVEKLAIEISADTDKPPHDTLSDREYEVLRMLGTGMTVTDIARELALSVKTISTYRTRILEKMRLTKTAELIRYAVQHDLVSRGPRREHRSRRRRAGLAA